MEALPYLFADDWIISGNHGSKKISFSDRLSKKGMNAHSMTMVRIQNKLNSIGKSNFTGLDPERSDHPNSLIEL